MEYVKNVKRTKKGMIKINKLTENIYGDIPTFLLPFLEANELQRITKVGMHCGMEYTSFPFYKDLKEYSRFVHSLNVALIISRFSNDKKVILSGLFHDISTPCFAHVIDFLKGDHLKQEATEEKTKSIIENSSIIQKELNELSISTVDVSDYHKYPIADNSSPMLSSDRLEYSLSNMYNFGFTSLDKIKEMYDDLTLTINENKEEEICFKHKEIALEFTKLTLMTTKMYITDEDRYGMEYLAYILKKAVNNKIINEEELFKLNEEELIKKLYENNQSKEDFVSFQKLNKVIKEDKPSSIYSFKIDAKRRYINPLIKDIGRVIDIDNDIKKEIDNFKNKKFDYYLVKAN